MILPLDTQQIADLDRVGTIIDRQGIDAVPDGLLQSLARDAKTLGVRPVAASILIDPHDPSVARERALRRPGNRPQRRPCTSRPGRGRSVMISLVVDDARD